MTLPQARKLTAEIQGNEYWGQRIVDGKIERATAPLVIIRIVALLPLIFSVGIHAAEAFDRYALNNSWMLPALGISLIFISLVGCVLLAIHLDKTFQL